MQLKQIDILNYKSITSPVSIKFKEGEVVTLIGKNGSGKTNILEALEQIFKSNAKQIFYHGNPNELKYKVHLLLDTNEVSQLHQILNMMKVKVKLLPTMMATNLK